MKSINNEEFIKGLLLKVADLGCPERKDIFYNPFAGINRHKPSRRTCGRCQMESHSIVVNETTDMQDTWQLVV